MTSIGTSNGARLGVYSKFEVCFGGTTTSSARTYSSFYLRRKLFVLTERFELTFDRILSSIRPIQIF